MISCPSVHKQVIQRHYNVATVFYRLLWGAHIHHGYWQGDESVHEAQVQLTERLATLAGITGGETVLDVGCGMGGSSIYLAKHRNCSVTGITVSGLQRHWATLSAGLRGLGGRVRFERTDAETFELPEASLDVLWSIECTEHLFDKASFFEKAARWLRPGGRIAVCAWLAGETDDDPARHQQVLDVCEGFYCPSLGTMSDYRGWFEQAGLVVQESQDWTANVLQTWEICDRRVKRSGVRKLAPWIDQQAVPFLDRFGTILEAYRSGAMKYGCFVARKTEPSLR